MTRYFMGIDGGGSNLRVVIVDADMQSLVTVRHGTANPNIIGREAASDLIQSAMREALETAAVKVIGVGIGIAGASARYASDWLHEVVRGVLPDVHIAAASDIEIALVGANGKREGVLLLCGTGSVALGINEAGKSWQVGGWGYLLGDEGSGYWIGMQALQVFTQVSDGQLRGSSSLTQRIRDELKLDKPTDILRWVYEQKPTPVAGVAKLASLVLEEAENGDEAAERIITEAAHHLVHLVHTAKRELDMTDPTIAFAGGLLASENILSAIVRDRLGLSDHPQATYPPMIGAALLAKLTYKSIS